MTGFGSSRISDCINPSSLLQTCTSRADAVASQNQWREQLAFALSTAVILTAIQERPERVRGVFGKVLGSVINTRA